MECEEAESKRRVVTINVIRHGYAEHNQAKDAIGPRAYFSNKYRYSQLVDKGKTQAMELRFMLNDTIQNIDRIYTSPLDRAMQTTDIVFSEDSNNNRHRIYVTDDLREMGYAHPCNERKSANSLSKDYPDFNYTLMKSDRDIMFFEGDTHNRFISMVEEIKEFVSNWYDRNGESERTPIIVLVSHESFLLEFAHNYLNIDLKSIDNCEMVSFEVDIDHLL
jgi:broad specificity phosphatase PhoE